jgi:ankyrin repeat protein
LRFVDFAADEYWRITVRSLLQKKADVNAAQTDGTAALHWAVRWDDMETADLLIRAGANVCVANSQIRPVSQFLFRSDSSITKI